MKTGRKSFEGREFVSAGRVRRARGIKGELCVDWNNGRCPVEIGRGPSTSSGHSNIYLQEKADGSLEKFTVVADRPHAGGSIVGLKEISSRTDAEKYRGLDIWVPAAELPRLPEGEYYSYQLIGMKVMTTEGEYLGDVEGIFATGSNDVYVVKNGYKEILIPAISDVVKKVDVSIGVMEITLIEGLV